MYVFGYAKIVEIIKRTKVCVAGIEDCVSRRIYIFIFLKQTRLLYKKS